MVFRLSGASFFADSARFFEKNGRPAVASFILNLPARRSRQRAHATAKPRTNVRGQPINKVRSARLGWAQILCRGEQKPKGKSSVDVE
jgi:hypothetical protein